MLKTFKIGGVHPAENKLSAQKHIEVLALPKSVFIPVGQHIGAPAEAIVQKGEKVKVGQLIAKSSGFVSANIHSSVSGTVKKIETGPDTSGYNKTGIYIDVEDDIWEESIDRSPEVKTEFNLDSAAILAKIQQAGIVGLGGATFPTHVKLTPPKGMKAEVLLINGVECEPYLTSDHRMMLEHGAEVVVGIRLLMQAMNVNKAFVGIENNKPDAIAQMEKLCNPYTNISVVPLKVKYPQGGEKQLIKAVTGREIASGALPISVGAVVTNIATTFAVYEAVQKNKPLFERVVTVTGKSVKNPSNYKVRIGIPISQLIEATGGLPENCGKIINGGPMMGKAVTNTEIPVTKGTSGVLMLPDN
ncbi:MAG: electron transport complex subunit RsxC, partial [Verrucomicrobia bacterium]|nr:electron transport complex subunit RsxC [Prolixibacteraceae bacterium]